MRSAHNQGLSVLAQGRQLVAPRDRNRPLSPGVFLDASVAEHVLKTLERRARTTKEETVALTPHLSRWEHLRDTQFAYALYLGVAYTSPSKHDRLEGLTGFRYWCGGDAGYQALSGRKQALAVLQGEMPECATPTLPRGVLS